MTTDRSITVVWREPDHYPQPCCFCGTEIMCVPPDAKVIGLWEKLERVNADEFADPECGAFCKACEEAYRA